MPIEQEQQAELVPGSIVEGVVQGITKFGAFVELPNGTVGLVHISEIADTFVHEVSEYLKVGDQVRVRILSVSGNKVALSIKQARERRPNTMSLDDKINRFLKESEDRQAALRAKDKPRRRH